MSQSSDNPIAMSPGSSLTNRGLLSHTDVASVQNSLSESALRNVAKHLPEHTLKAQGGDIARDIHNHIDIAEGHSGANLAPRHLTRSSSFSTFLDDSRRGSTASDMMVPGGFRRAFLVDKSLKKNQAPPNFVARNFVEFLSIYGHFAGEDFDDDDDSENDEESNSDDQEYGDEAVDDELSLIGDHRNRVFYNAVPKQIPLRKSHRKRRAATGLASVPKTYFLLFKSLVGSGVLFLPRAFCNGGLVFSTITIGVFGLLTFVCYLLLINARNTLACSSYGELGYKTHGKVLRIFILLLVLLSQVGFVAIYILFTAENTLSFVKAVWPSVLPDILNARNIVIIQCIALIPLVLIRNLTKLSLISLVSSAFVIIGLIIIFYYCGETLWLNGPGSGIVAFNSKSWPMLIGVAVTSFEGIGLVLPIELSMKSPEKFPRVLAISMFAITILFATVGFIGYSAYGEQVKSIIILNLPQDKFLVQLILILYSLAVFMTAPLQLFPATKIGESLIFHHSNVQDLSNRRDRDRLTSSDEHADGEGRLYRHSGKYNSHVKWLKNLFRAAVVCLICLLAYSNANNIDKFVSINGCFACIPLVYIYPPMIHLKLLKVNAARRPLTRLELALKVCDYVLICVGTVTVFYTTIQILTLH